jgi:hypothetical protein
LGPLTEKCDLIGRTPLIGVDGTRSGFHLLRTSARFTVESAGPKIQGQNQATMRPRSKIDPCAAARTSSNEAVVWHCDRTFDPDTVEKDVAAGGT